MGLFSTLKNIGLYLWFVKSLFLVPWDIFTDVKLAITHFSNGHIMWGSLTAACLLPSLMFPYLYFNLLKCAVFKLIFMFLGFKNIEQKINALEKKNLICKGIFAYFEDIPQFVLQVYILWKTPRDCFSWREIEAVQSIGTSFLSISATVVPFYEKEKDKKWTLFSCKGFFLNFLMGTFFNVIPKLVLISWAFSILNVYGWFLIMPLLLMCVCMSCCCHCLKKACKDGKNEEQDEEQEKEEEEEETQRWQYVMFRSVQLMFGYSGLAANLIVGIMLLLFLIPLGLNLAAVINSSKETYSDPFDMFPKDPFPSSTICFTNFSIIEQQERYENNNTPFSNSCNKTYEAIPCSEVREDIITKLCIMIGVLSSGHLATVCCGCLSLLIIGFLGKIFDMLCCCCKNEDENDDDEDKEQGKDNDEKAKELDLLGNDN